jgi:hypothetical protein
MPLLSVVMLIGAKSNHNHYLIMCFLHQNNLNNLKILHVIKSNILFHKCSKYEIISSTFGPSKVMLKNL